MVRDGIPFVLAPLILAIILLATGYWALAAILGFIAAFMAFFFRDP
nr:phosphatidylserine decarboxylase family protein [Pyrinomonadaceae bacterium]